MSIDGITVAVLIPAYNEERQIGSVLGSLPEYVDHIVVVDDASTDDTRTVVADLAREDPRIRLVGLDENLGVGGAIAIAYRLARDEGYDIAVTVDGDGQMDPQEMTTLIQPILDDVADYTKGNRLTDAVSWRLIPPVRLFGNAVLSLLTKIASGYWLVADSQSGYTAAGRYALEHIDWDSLYHSYGRPNDILVLANMADCRVADVPIRPVYGVGERSSMRILKVTFTISWLLFRRFWWRIFRKHLVRDFHPLLFFYLFATLLSALGTGFSIRLLWIWATAGFVPQITALASAFFWITAFNSMFFAFWMDMQANEHLAVRLHPRHRGKRRPSAVIVGPDGSPPGQEYDRSEESVRQDVEHPR